MAVVNTKVGQRVTADVAAQTDRVIRLKDGKVLSDVKATGDQKFMTGADLLVDGGYTAW